MFLMKYWHLFISILTLMSIFYFYDSPKIPQTFCISKKSTLEKMLDLNQSEIIPPLRMFEKRFRKSAALKLNICVIEKNLSTILTAIACYFYNPTRFRNASKNVNTEVFKYRFCQGRNEASTFMGRVKNGLNIAHEWLHLSVSRDPIERFVSGFVDKCLIEQIYKKRPGTCNNCKGNVTCFVEREYERMKRFARGDRVNSFDDRHFFPQLWRCDYAHYFKYFKIIRYTSHGNGPNEFYAQLFQYMRQQNASEENVRFVEDQVKSGKTDHTTSSSEERKKMDHFVRQSNLIMNYLLRMYFYDFLLFGFTLPEIVVRTDLLNER